MGARIAISLTVVGFGLATIPAWAVDSDVDGIDDSFDNCRAHANPQQFDADSDGWGNRCDVDLNQDGMADGRDVRFFVKAIRANDPVADINEDGQVDHQDPITAADLWGNPPGPGAAPADDDGDGVPGAQDECVESIGSASSLIDGCNAVDLAIHVKRRNFDPAARLLTDPFFGVEFSPMFELPIASLLEGLDRLQQAADKAARGEPCAAEETALTARSMLENAAEDFDVAFGHFRARLDVLFAPQPGEEEEPGELDDAMQPYRLARSNVHTGVAKVANALEEIETLCQASVGPEQVTGRVQEVDMERRSLKLDSGEEFGLAAGFVRLPDPLLGEWEVISGIDVELDVVRFNDGTGLIREAGLLGALADISLDSLDCGAVRIAPFQLDPYYTGQDRVFHLPDGYTRDGVLQLEEHMRVGISTANCEQPDPPFSSIYGARISYDFPGSFPEVVAEFLTQGQSVPVPTLYDDSDSRSFAILVRIRKRDCNEDLGVCGPAQDLSLQTHDARLRPMHHYCQVDLSPDSFTLERDGGFAVSQVVGRTVKPPVQLEDTFSALGYRIIDGVPDSIQTEIGAHEPFAIFPTDIRDAHRAIGRTDEEIDLLIGTERSSGIVWPRIEGTHPIARYWYSCAPDFVARDALAQCVGVDSYYEYFFDEAVTGQPPFGMFSHLGNACQGSPLGYYAWDIGKPEGTPIYAGRGGKVVIAEDGSSENCPDGGCDGNHLMILHQDGTVSNYRHLVQGGVLVERDDYVQRGQVVALVGNTGRSTDAHLHFGTEYPGEDFVGQCDDVPVAAKFHVLKKVDGEFEEVFCDSLLFPGIEVRYISD